MPQPKTLVAVLDWGLGHATRSIPLIAALRSRGLEVCLAGSGASLAILEEFFPELQKFELPAYDVRYSKSNRQVATILRQVPRLLSVIQEEHTLLDKWVKQEGIERCFSDNRYGLWHRDIPCIGLCHQLSPRLPGILQKGEKLLYQIHMKYLNKFDELWVPDMAGSENLGGSMSHPAPRPKNVRYIGLLSRFSHTIASASFSDPSLSPDDMDILAVLSGPEPQRSLFEAMLIAQHKNSPRKLWIIQGNPTQGKIVLNGNLCLIPHLRSAEMALALQAARVVISRAGYSSLMDYATLKLDRLILVPTPGQTEQEYLGKRLQEQDAALCFRQTDFYLPDALASLKSLEGISISPSQLALENALDSMLD